MANYRYIYYPEGAIVLQSSNINTQVELNRITRYLFGEGGAANKVFNCGVGAFIKFQTKPELNKNFAYLTTAVWRRCKKKNIPISHELFIKKKESEPIILDLEKIIQDAKNKMEVHKHCILV
jgi:hypothetical protein